MIRPCRRSDAQSGAPDTHRDSHRGSYRDSHRESMRDTQKDSHTGQTPSDVQFPCLEGTLSPSHSPHPTSPSPSSSPVQRTQSSPSHRAAKSTNGPNGTVSPAAAAPQHSGGAPEPSQRAINGAAKRKSCNNTSGRRGCSGAQPGCTQSPPPVPAHERSSQTVLLLHQRHRGCPGARRGTNPRPQGEALPHLEQAHPCPSRPGVYQT